MAVNCVIGRQGFIGGALAKRLGDVSSVPNEETRVLYHFGSHVHPVFEQNPEYEMKRLLDDFSTLLPYCYKRGIKFVYPSSALVYERETTFSRFKKTLELLAGCYETSTLGLRIYPAYGPGEQRTVISKWCRQMLDGQRPAVYGDGKQTRDFIYIDDVIDQIVFMTSERFQHRVVDIGTGVRTSFNEIVDTINRLLGSTIKPLYVDRPSSYSEGIVCPSPLPVKVSVELGIRYVLQSMTNVYKYPELMNA
jgi:nucleoside-diphosphate-sugar epimerase